MVKATEEHSAEKARVHAHLTDVLDGWPIGEPCQEISRSEAIELSKFVIESLARRGVTLHVTPPAATDALHYGPCVHCGHLRDEHGERGACLRAGFYGNKYDCCDEDHARPSESSTPPGQTEKDK